MTVFVPSAATAFVVVLVLTATTRPSSRRPDDTIVVHRPSSAGSVESLVARWRLRRSRRRPPSARSVADWCDDLARRLRSGATLREALATAAPSDPSTASAVGPVLLAIERGASIADATRRGGAGPHLRLALSVIRTASSVGGPSAEAIDRTAMALRRRAADADERATQAAQARLSTHVMTVLPLAMLALMMLSDEDVRLLVASPAGGVIVVTGLSLNLIGWWWMRRIVGAPA